MAVYESKKITKDGRKYFFRVKYKDLMGVTHDYSSAKFKLKKEALEEEARFKIKVANKEAFVTNLTFKQIYDEYELKKRLNIKAQSYRQDDNMFQYYLFPFADKKINDINVAMYNSFYLDLGKKNISLEYKNKIIRLLKSLIKYSHKYYNTNDSVIDFIETFDLKNKEKKEVKFFTLQDYQKFDKVITDFYFHVFFEVLYYVGLRKGEIQALTWNDINFKNKTISINKTITRNIKGVTWAISTPKTKASIRTIPVTDKVIHDLKKLKQEIMIYKDFKEEWFVFGNIKPLGNSVIDNRKNKFCDEAELERIKVHGFRHSCASLLINQKASITLLSKYLGHANVNETLKTYAHLYESELTDIINILNKL